MSLDPKMVFVLRAIHSEVCEGVAADAVTIRTHVASRLLEAAQGGKTLKRELKSIGRAALLEATTIDRRRRLSHGHGNHPLEFHK
ncbi:hypothetical protein [Bradyrhizobium mercantei]|uniref:hypothetical protein n=1 Tax=Bradyrhizobium mercantei TaxID=1904807 RepID=UPI001FDA44FB|nr:hypothetical protein [Bradyrhizobium mercantei]